MQKYFRDLQGFVESTYPEFQGNISGGLYPPPKYCEVIAQITGYIWIAGVALLMVGNHIFTALGIPEPEWYIWMKNNRMAAFIGLFMLNNVGHSFVATGAFEVYLNDELIYSKLQTGRMPSTTAIITALSAHGYKPY